MKSSIDMGFSFILLYPFTLLNKSIPSATPDMFLRGIITYFLIVGLHKGQSESDLKKTVVLCKRFLSTLWRFEALHSYYLAGLFASVLFLVPGIHGSEFKSRKPCAAWKFSPAFTAQKDMPVGSQI